MSCLPEIFASASQPLPTKVGGPYSLHLRQNHFSIMKSMGKPSPARTKMTGSLQKQRYRSWMQDEQTYRASRTGSRSFHSQLPTALQEKGWTAENVNQQPTHQAEVEAISNFNVIRKNAFQAVMLAQRTLEISKEEQQRLREEMNKLKEVVLGELQSIETTVREKLTSIHVEFKKERREDITEGKAINQQMLYLQEDMAMTVEINKQVHLRFSAITRQFL